MTDSRLESGVEAFLFQRVRILGGYAIKLAPTERGIPDRLVILPGGHMYLVELKTSKGELSPIQRVFHERLAGLGADVITLYGKEDVVDWLRSRFDAIAEAESSKRKYRRRQVG